MSISRRSFSHCYILISRENVRSDFCPNNVVERRHESVQHLKLVAVHKSSYQIRRALMRPFLCSLPFLLP